MHLSADIQNVGNKLGGFIRLFQVSVRDVQTHLYNQCRGGFSQDAA